MVLAEDGRKNVILLNGNGIEENIIPISLYLRDATDIDDSLAGSTH